MLNPATWALLADLYSPFLVVVSLYSLGRMLLRDRHQALENGLRLLGALAWVYGVMALDLALTIWGRWGADYSTHTAFALAFVLFLARNSLGAVLWGISLVLYAILMILLGYHTLTDILSTALVLIVPLTATLYIGHRRVRLSGPRYRGRE